MKTLVIIGGLLVAFSAFGQSKDLINKSFTPQQLQTDFAIARQLLEMVHPALYDVVSKKQLNREFNSAAKHFNHDMTGFKFFKTLSPIIGGIGCGHTAIGLPVAEDNYIKSFFPLKVKFLNEKAYIIAAPSGYDNLVGDEIVSINKEPIRKIIKQLMKYITTDGINSSHRYMLLDKRFDLYYGIYIAQPDKFELSLKTSKEINVTTTIPGISQRFNKQTNIARANKSITSFYITIPNKQVAILTINLFMIKNKTEDYQNKLYKNFLDSCFIALKEQKVENLIIDLSKNPGGYGTWGAWLYSYLSDKPFNYYSKAVVATNENLPFINYTDWKQDEYKEYVKDIIISQSGGLEWPVHDNLKLQQPNPNHFDGPVYVLIGRNSFSTTAEFCAIARSNKRAIFIGEETGGGYNWINGGDMMEMILPNTKVKLLIPMRKYILAVKGDSKRHGTLPDYYAIPTIKQFLNGTDVETARAMQLIINRNK